MTRRAIGPLVCLAVMVITTCGAATASAGTHIWNADPAQYPIIDPQAVADMVITYDVDLSGFTLWQNRRLSPAELARFNDEIHQAFDAWNEVLAPIGLQFRPSRPGEPYELGVRAAPYDYFDDYFGQTGDSVALSLAWPFTRVYTILPIWFDSSEPFGVTRDAPVLADHLLSQPYLTLVDSEQFDLYTVAVHEIGHVLGLGHVGDAIRLKYNYNYLGNSTVQVDPRSLAPSAWLGGMQVDLRRPILETELYSIMVPLRYAYNRIIPPEDRATVAFTLRNLNPAGADQVLASARYLYEQTTPLRFINVLFEQEKSGANDRNNTPATAMPIRPGQVIVGSLFGPDIDDRGPDCDCYRLDLSDTAAGTALLLDIDEAGGLTDVGATEVNLSLLDRNGTTLAVGEAAGSPPDDGSYCPQDPILTYTLKTPGVYFIRVGQSEAATPGTYVLKVGVGTPAEPIGEQTPTIDAAGAGTVQPMAPSPLDGLCPGVGFTALSLSLAGLWLTRLTRPSKET